MKLSTVLIFFTNFLNTNQWSIILLKQLFDKGFPRDRELLVSLAAHGHAVANC